MDIMFLKKLILEGKEVLKTKFEQDDGQTIMSYDPFSNELEEGQHFVDYNTYVNHDLFLKWYEKVKIFLKQTEFEDSIVKPNSSLKNYDITKQQIAKLQAILEITESITKTEKNIQNFNSIFIGHGHHLLWARIGLYLSDILNIKPKYFENNNRISEIIPFEIEKFVDDSNIKMAIFTLMKEDETKEGKFLPRQNVIDEVGRFSTKLGRNKIVLILENGVEKPSNLQGILHINFDGDEESVLLKIKDKIEKEEF